MFNDIIGMGQKRCVPRMLDLRERGLRATMPFDDLHRFTHRAWIDQPIANITQ